MEFNGKQFNVGDMVYVVLRREEKIGFVSELNGFDRFVGYITTPILGKPVFCLSSSNKSSRFLIGEKEIQYIYKLEVKKDDNIQ